MSKHSFIGELESAISQGSSERRAESLRHVTDLFLHGAASYSEEQVALFGDVIGRLAAQIETSARALLAQRLAPVANAPLNVLRDLACDDEISVAHPVLTQSERLDEETLLAAAQGKSQLHLMAIASRPFIAPAVTTVLVARGEPAVVLSTVRNAGARFSDEGFALLVRLSDGDDELAMCVGTRPEIPRHLFLKLLATASHSARASLERANPQAADEIRRLVGEVADRIQSTTIADSHDYARAQACVGALHDAGQLAEREVDEFASAGLFEETVVAIALLCDVTIEVVERAMVHDRPELLLILLKAAAMSWRTAKSVIVLRAGASSPAPSEIEHCLASFERLKPATARQVVRFHQTRSRAATS